MELNVPTSKPLPKKDNDGDKEKKDEIKNITGISKAKNIILSFGMENLPSIRQAINQKNRDIITPIETKNPLLTSRPTDRYGKKKNIEKNKVDNRDQNDILLNIFIFFDCIVLF